MKIGWIDAIFGIAAMLLGVLAIAALTIHAWGWSASNVAAWVQAVGSIGAIIGAFMVGHRQAEASRRQAIEMESLAREREIGAIAAVLQHAVDQAEASAQSFMNIPTDALRLALQAPIYTLSEATEALLSIPLHETGSSAAVTHFAQVQVALKDMVATIERFKTLDRAQALMAQFDSAAQLNRVLQIAQRSAAEYVNIVRMDG